MLNVLTISHRVECCYAERHYAESCYAEFRYAECGNSESNHAELRYVGLVQMTLIY